MDYTFDQSIKYGPDNNFKFDSSAIDAIFLNKFKKPKPSMHKAYRKEYLLNSSGFRSDEFINKPDILFAGCSHTFGCGTTDRYLWTKVVADHFKTGHYNLGVPGASIMSIVSNIFEYFRIYGNPKVVVCLFPDPQRTFRLKNYHFGYSREDYNPDYNKILNEDDYYDHIQHLHQNLKIPKFIKLPTEIQNIIQPDTSYYLSMLFINMLEQYCITNNIKFIWSMWLNENMESIDTVRSRNYGRLEGAIDLEIDCWEADKDEMIDRHYSNGNKNDLIECHKDLLLEDQHTYHMGFDRAGGKDDIHWGSHRHRHIADSFIDAIAKTGIFWYDLQMPLPL